MLGDYDKETIDNRITGEIEYILNDKEACYHLKKYANTLEAGPIRDILHKKVKHLNENSSSIINNI